MNMDCCDKNPLRRDGTSQQQRLLKALLPGYVAVDERSMDDLIEFVKQYAREIQFYKIGDKNEYLPEAEFYDIDNHKYGNWEKFFDKLIDKKLQLTEPHYALFIAFLKLFKYALDDLNQLTKKHIEFYYKDVLQLSEKPAVSDQVYLIFELAKHASSYRVKKGSKLKAGKDNTGVEIIYETDREIVVNKAQISELKTLFFNNNDIFCDLSPYPDNDYCLYASSMANSSDGEGGEIETEDESWKTFGLPELTYNKDEKKYDSDRLQADIGFAFASPILFLAEGDRLISVTLTFSESNETLLKNIAQNYDLSKAFNVMFSGEKEWIEPIEEDVDKFAESKALDLINNAKLPQDIAGTEPQAGPIFDDPTTGSGDQVKDYDIGILVADRIIKERDKLPNKKFISIPELLKVRGFGPDKLNDIKYSFREKSLDTFIDKNKIIIKRKIFKYQAPIVQYNKEVLNNSFNTNWPIVKILLNTDEIKRTYIYKNLADLNIVNAEIKVEVTSVKSIILQNDFSELNPAKPFLPFTNKPVLGSNFYIGNWEVFQKKPESIDLNIAWHKLPENIEGFQGYYKYYVDSYDGAERANSKFKINISYLNNKEWISVNKQATLFTDENGNEITDGAQLPVDKTVKINALSSELALNIEREEELEEFKIFDESTQRGFMKLELNGIDFGHSTYQLSYTKAVLIGVEESKKADGTKDYTDKLPNEPYTPTIKELSLDYSSSENFNLNNLSEESYEKRVEQFFHIHPFGVEEIKTTNKKNYLLPQYSDEGTLFIGIKNLDLPQSLSILYKVSEGSPDPDLTSQTVTWYYLVDNEWKIFEKNDILLDSTNSLITSGIISFNISKTATSDNTILTQGLYWIKATVIDKSKAVADLISITSQAITARFKDNNNDPDYLRKPLEAESIKKLKESNSSISKISQPYSSFGGKVKEHDSELYIRISERLRHKARAITIWDYERLVLEQFPSIYKVKCLNHTKYSESISDSTTKTKCQKTTGKSTFVEIAPGNVTLIVISNVRNINAVDPLKPKTSLNILTEIKEYVLGLCSKNVDLYVMNPKFEEVKVDFKVKFHKQYDAIYYQRQLNSEIKEFLAPWAFDTDSDVIFGGKIHKSKILNFIEEREYVDFVTCFKMSLITNEGVETGDIEIAEATTSASILTSVKFHNIETLETDACECEGNEQFDITIAPGDKCQCDK